MSLPLTGAGPSAAGGGYTSKVLGIETANLIAYWPLSEAAGAVADNAEGTAARDGAYDGPTLGQPGIGDGATCPSFDGINDNVAIYSASLATAFDGDKGTYSVWFKAAAIPTTGYICGFFVDGNNYFQVYRFNADTYRFKCNTAASFIGPAYAGFTDGTWWNVVFTWLYDGSANTDYEIFRNGSSIDATQKSVGQLTGSIGNDSRIGTENAGGGNPYAGWIAHCAVWDKVLSDAQILALATV